MCTPQPCPWGSRRRGSWRGPGGACAGWRSASHCCSRPAPRSAATSSGTRPARPRRRPHSRHARLRLAGRPDPQFQLGNGNCGNGQVAPGRSLTSNESVDCGSPHDFEIYNASTAVSSNSLRIQPPSAQQLNAEADSICAIVFYSAWITPADKATTLTYTALVPSTRAWQANPSSQTGTARSSAYSPARTAANSPVRWCPTRPEPVAVRGCARA